MLRVMSPLARPLSPTFARQAHAAVVFNTTDMTLDVSAIRGRIATIPATTLDDVIRRQPTLEAPRTQSDAPGRGGTQGPRPSSSKPPVSSNG